MDRIENAKILVIDDEPVVRFSLSEILTRDGYQVTTVASGEAALELMQKEDFDLALIDLKLEGIDGMQVLSTMRELSPETVPIVLTAYATLESAVEALRQGAHDYLFKPCKTVELRESVRSGLLKLYREKRQRALLSWLEQDLADNLRSLRTPGPETRSEPPPPPAPWAAGNPDRFLQRGALIVDSVRHVITLNGQLLELSPTEFDLLAYLVSEAPRVVPAQELVREVQGYESESWEARDIVRYHIYRIRRKMQKAGGQGEVIRTMRGVGYTVEE